MSEMSTPRRARRLLPLATMAVVAGAAVAWSVTTVAPDLTLPDSFFVDFRINLWEPGRQIFEGNSPLREVTAEENGGIYPPAAVVATLPLAVLPYKAAATAWVIMLVAAVVGALYLANVRDVRCFALALASPPVIAGIAYGNVSMLVVLALSYIWVSRDRPGRSGVVLGIVVAARLFLWPLLFWLLVTRRVRAAAVAAASTVVSSLIGWAAVAFHGIEEFPALTRANASEFLDQSVSVASIFANLDASPDVVALATVFAGAIALLFAWRRRADDLFAFAWCVAAALFASPVVWGHYYALMLVPLAITTPALSRHWLLPYLTAPQLTSSPTSGGRILDAVTGVGFTIATVRLAERRGSDRTRT